MYKNFGILIVRWVSLTLFTVGLQYLLQVSHIASVSQAGMPPQVGSSLLMAIIYLCVAGLGWIYAPIIAGLMVQGISTDKELAISDAAMEKLQPFLVACAGMLILSYAVRPLAAAITHFSVDALVQAVLMLVLGGVLVLSPARVAGLIKSAKGV